MGTLRIWRVFALSAVAASAAVAQHKPQDFAKSLAPYVVSSQEVVERMLEVAGVRPGETVYDLGCGDGRILIMAARQFRAKAVGIEISDSLVRSTSDRILKMGLQNDVEVIHGDLLNVDLNPADVVTLYLTTNLNESLRPNLERYLKPGARVVSHEFRVPGWKPNRVEKTDSPSHPHVIYLYIMPPNKK